MKKTILAVLMFGTLLAGGSCSKDFVEQEKPLVTNPEDIFSKPDKILKSLIGCYANFKNTGTNAFLGGKMYVVADSRGEDVVNLSNPVSLQDTYEMNVNSGTTENTNFWKMAYYAINTCNIFIDNMAAYNCEKLLGADTYNQYIAEAKFLRAYSYYALVQLYSQPYSINPNAKAVPLRLKGLTSSGNNPCPRSTISQIYTAILADLAPAALMDAPKTRDGVTRASKGAAYMLQMRVYMAMEDWGKAITAGELVKGYELDPDVSKLYGVDTYKSPEMIFALPMATTDTPNTQLGVSEYYGITPSVCTLDTKAGILSQADYSNPKDLRISKLTLTSNGELYTKKFVTASKLDWIPQMRYAETLLNLAECYANQTDGTTKAKALLKQVRERSLEAADDTIDVDALAGGALLPAIYNERRLELLCEGIRNSDIMRRGETFVKGTNINVKPTDVGYTWPIPQTEIQFNPEINK